MRNVQWVHTHLQSSTQSSDRYLTQRSYLTCFDILCIGRIEEGVYSQVQIFCDSKIEETSEIAKYEECLGGPINLASRRNLLIHALL